MGRVSSLAHRVTPRQAPVGPEWRRCYSTELATFQLEASLAPTALYGDVGLGTQDQQGKTEGEGGGCWRG